MTTYTITVKPYKERSFAPPAWAVAVRDLDNDADFAQMDDSDNGNMVYEVASNADLSPVTKVRGVVSVERHATVASEVAALKAAFVRWPADAIVKVGMYVNDKVAA